MGTVKRCLKKVVGKARLDYDELQTILIEVESIVNSRPLTYVYDELESEPLTPSHLLYGRRLAVLPDKRDPEHVDRNVNFSKRYRYLVSKISHFWNRWHQEYLVDLREQHKIVEGRTSSIKIGDMALLKEDNVKRQLWKMGMVERLIVGKDNQVRGAKVRTISRDKPQFLFRPLQKLYPLEVRDGDPEKTETNENVTEKSEQKLKDVELKKVRNEEELGDREEENGEREKGERVSSVRPRRAAAQDARWRTRLLLDSGESRRGDVLGNCPGNHHTIARQHCAASKFPKI